MNKSYYYIPFPRSANLDQFYYIEDEYMRIYNTNYKGDTDYTVGTIGDLVNRNKSETGAGATPRS